MEQEEFYSGYCRQLDDARMVAVFLVDGQLEEVDCRYGDCPHQPNCQIARQIEELLKQ